MQNEETNEKTRINYKQGQHVMYVWAPLQDGEVVKETEKVSKGSRLSSLATESDDEQDFTWRA